MKVKTLEIVSATQIAKLHIFFLDNEQFPDIRYWLLSTEFNHKVMHFSDGFMRKYVISYKSHLLLIVNCFY